MAFKLHSRILETTITTGTGTYTLAGAVTGFKAFSSEHSNADTCWYFVSSGAYVAGVWVPGADYECGIGTYSAGTLARTTILGSSNADAAVNWAAGSKLIGTAPLGISDLASANLSQYLDVLLASVTTVNTGPIGGWRNLLINPDGRINQRAPATNADDTYGHDRWYALTQTNTIAVSTLTDVENGTPRMFRLTQSQAVAQRMGYAQIIEGANCKHLRGKQVTLGGRFRCSAAQAIRIAILEWTGTEDAVTSDVVNDWTSADYTDGAAKFFVDTSFTPSGNIAKTPGAATLTDLDKLTVTLGSTFNNLVILMWTEGTAAQNVTLDGALQLEVGAVASQREFRPITVEMELCQRYYRKIGGVNAGGYPRLTGYLSASSTVVVGIPFIPPMRAAPTGAVAGTWGVTNCGQPAILGATADGSGLSSLVTAAGAYEALMNGTDDFLTFAAEL